MGILLKNSSGAVGSIAAAGMSEVHYKDNTGNVSLVWSSGLRLSDMPVGALIRFTVNNAPWNFLVVHQGKPSAMYDTSFDGGTILLMQNLYTPRVWHDSNMNSFSSSAIFFYVNGTFRNLIDANIRALIRQVRIPYRPGTSGTTVNSGANGLPAYVWLLGGYEVNWTLIATLPADGAPLSYFADMEQTDARRIAYFNGTATPWWLRSPNTTSTNVYQINQNGGTNNTGASTYERGVRPAVVLPGTTLIDPAPNADGSYNIIV